MFVEGKIDRRYLEVLLAAGYEPDWVCNTSEEAVEKDYLGLNESCFDEDVVVRIWIDMDIEDFFKPEDLIVENKKLLALMATVGHEGLRKFAEKELKK